MYVFQVIEKCKDVRYMNKFKFIKALDDWRWEKDNEDTFQFETSFFVKSELFKFYGKF